MFVHDRQFLNPVFVQNFPRLLQTGAFRRGNKLVALHHLRHLQFHSGLESQIAIRQNSHQLAALGYRDSGDPVPGHQVVCIADGLIRRDCNGIQDHPTLGFFHFINFGSLVDRRENAVHDADPALLRHRNGQARFCHSIHGGADDGNIQLNVSRQTSSGIDLAREDMRFRRHQDDVIIRQSNPNLLLQHQTPPSPRPLARYPYTLSFCRPVPILQRLRPLPATAHCLLPPA